MLPQLLQGFLKTELPLQRSIGDIIYIAADHDKINLLTDSHANKPPEGGEGGLP
ncbi:hypothetical protein D3C81_2291440 [compost metagenome]